MTSGAPQQPPAQGERPPGSPLDIGQIGGRPAELVVAAVLFAGAAIYVLIDALLKLGDVFDLFDFSDGNRPGLYFLFSVITFVVISASLLGTAWLILNADPRGRILAVVIALGWAIAMIASRFRFYVVKPLEDQGTALSLTLGLIAVLVGAALTFLPGAHRAFASGARVTFSAVEAVRLALYGLAGLLLIQGAFLLIAVVGESGRETANAIILVVTALGVGAIAVLLATRRPELRLALTGLAVAVFITSLILGPRYFAIVFLLSCLLILPLVLWLAADARTYYGETPISLTPVSAAPGASDGSRSTGSVSATGSSRPFSRPGPGAQACTSCGAALEEGDAFCSSCGTRVPEPVVSVRVCSSCGREAAADAAFCSGCGTRLEDPAPPSGPRACSSCGAELEEDARFCGACGTAAGGAQ